MKYTHKNGIVLLAILLVFSMSFIFAIKYENSNNIFDAKISYVNNVKLPYSIILNLENKVDSNLDYEIEVVYLKQNLVIASEQITCEKNCETKINLKKIFFDNYQVIIRTNYNGKFYEKVLKFKLDKTEQEVKTEIFIEDVYYNLSQTLDIEGKITRSVEFKEKYILELFPKGQEAMKEEYSLECVLKDCYFNFKLNSNIFLGEYIVRVYSTTETFEKRFNVRLYNESIIEEIISNETVINDNIGNNVNNNDSITQELNESDVSVDQSINEKIKVEINNTLNLEDKFDGNYSNLYNNLISNEIYLNYIFTMPAKEKESYYVSTLIYNDYLIKNNIVNPGYKLNFYSKFNISNYEIIYSDNLKSKLNENGTLTIDKLNKEEAILIIRNKIKLANNLSDENISYSILDILQNSVFVRVINEDKLTESLLKEEREIKTKENKIKKKVLLPQKFSNNNFEFEIEITENESKELSKIDNKISRLIDKKQVSKNTVKELIKKSNSINATMKFSGREIEFKNLEFDETGIDLRSKKLNKRFEINQTNKKGESEKVILNDLFAIDPEKVNFESAVMTKVAKGKALYKCKEWNYSTDTCYGTWVKILDLVPGQEYTLELDKYDPAFAESNIIFEDDFELGGALQSGLWTTVVEADSKLTQVWGSDTQYKYAGSYSLSDSPGGNYQPGAASTGFLPHHTIYTPAINLSGLTSANATFYQRLNLEPDTGTSCWDAITVKISTNRTNWNYTTIKGYTMRTISANSQAENVAGDGFAMCGDYSGTWTQVSINLTPYVGNQTVYISWSLIADDNTAFDGYNMDNFVVYGTENQNPKLLVSPSFNPTSITVGDSSYLNMTISDDTPVVVIGTMKFSNGTIQNYTILPEIKPKVISYNVLSSQLIEKGANVTVFSDAFADLRYWFVTIGTGLFDWNINTAQLRATAVTAPRPQYAAIASPIDLRNFSLGVIQYQYKEAGVEEANDCLLYSLNNGSGWSGNTNIFCDDLTLDNTYYSNRSITLNSSYMTKNFQMRFGADQFDQAAEAVWLDNFNITAWHNESKTTGTLFGPITYDNYTDITRINVTITIDSYSPNSSINKSNTKPDLYLALNDGSSNDLFNEVAVFNLSSVYTGNGLNTTDVNFTISITDSTILNYFKANQPQRYMRIGAKYLDYTSSTIYDEIIYKSVIVTFEGIGQTGNYAYNFSNFQTPGTHNLTNLYISDYFGLTNNTIYTNVNFTVNAYSSVFDGYLLSNNIYIGNISTMKCNVVDNSTKNPLNNYNVSYYRNSTYIGSNLTDSSGWSQFSFNDSSVSNSIYNITCNISNSLSTFYTATYPSSLSDILYVWSLGADTEKPNIFAGNGTPVLNNVGLGFNAWVNATDNQKVENVYFYVKKPGEGTYTAYLMNSPAALNGSGQYNYTFTGDSIAGTYYYYFRAEDNWTISNWNITAINSFSRVISDALIKIKNKNTTYKRLKDVQLTSYTYATISNTSVGELTSYIGPYVIFNNSFSDEFASWSFYTNPSGTSLYCGDGGTGYENLDTDTGGSATSRTDGVDNSAARFSMEGSSYTLGGTGYAYFEQNLSLAGYTSANATLYLADNGVPTQVSGGYPFTFDVYDGTWYQAFTQQGAGNSDVAIIASDYALKTVVLSGYNMINNFKIRMSGGGTAATTDHFAVDDVLVIAVATDKTSKSQNYTFGNSNLNLSFFNVQVTISSYDNRGSISNTEPDLSIEFYNGTGFAGKSYCSLESLYGFTQSSSLTDINCSVQIVDTNIISAWENPNNRKIRVNAEYVDVSSSGSDSINWTNVYLNYYTPSLIYNPGIINITSYISNRIYLNSTNELKGIVNITPITILNGSIYNLSQSWNAQNISLVDLPNGVYYSSSALTDGSGNIITDSNSNPIVSIDYFNLQNMYINVISPVELAVYNNNSVLINASLDTTYYSGGGWCGYSLNSNFTLINMSKINSTYYSASIPLLNFTSYSNSVIVYCNDSTSDIVISKNISFSVDTGFVISYVPPTDNDGASVNRSSTDINVSIVNIADTSAFINFNNSQVLYYNFENVSGVNVYDISGNSNDGILNGSKINITNKIRGNYSTYNRSNNEFTEIINPNTKFKDTFNSSYEFTVSTYFNPSLLSSGIKLPLFEVFNSSSSYLDLKVINTTGKEEINLIVSNLGVNNTLSTGDINILTNTWSHALVTFKSLNITHFNTSIYYNGNYINSTLINKDKFSNLNAKYYVGKSNVSNTYFNGSIDEFMVFNRLLSSKEIKSLYNSRVNPLENNFTNLVNGLYNYKACTIAEGGSYLCTENRSVIINRTLPSITINSPINGTKYNYNNLIYFNVSTSLPVSTLSYMINNNGTYYSMTNVSTLNWSNIISNLVGGYYNVTFYATDDAGNIVNASAYFYLTYAKNILIKKNIELNGINSYKVTLNITNNGNFTNYILHDFIDSNFTYYDLNLALTNSSNITGSSYNGKILKWDLILSSNNSSIITYNINGSGDYRLMNNFIIGSE